MAAYEMAYERGTHMRCTHEMAYGRGMPMRGTPVRSTSMRDAAMRDTSIGWSMGDILIPRRYL
jgi:hypothetical protein